jgi:exosortase
VAVAVDTPARPATTRAADADQGVWPRTMLALVGLGLIALYTPTVQWLIARWTMSVWHNAHGFLIPPAVAFFAWQELKPLQHLPRSASAWGFMFFLPAIALHVLDTGIHSQILSAISIVVALPGLSLLSLGMERTKAIAFPLAFSVFMLPIPLAVTERLHLALRHIATSAANFGLPLLGIDVFSEGTTLHLAIGNLEVGDGCSGFSTLYAAVAVAALTAYSCNHWRGRVLALVSAVPLAIGANVLRVILLAVLAHTQGLWVLESWMHPASGMLTFAIALPIILWLGASRPAAAPADTPELSSSRAPEPRS